ncbi:MFS transporter [Aliarcobacter skirrowii]|uniref:hypothetical protein n=1 Tax=Aliarcobacter skirrowii TaxID=28200 RepID=UPI00083112B5|nr:hypothetical protein [Aliarcobacter skirrowii]
MKNIFLFLLLAFQLANAYSFDIENFNFKNNEDFNINREYLAELSSLSCGKVEKKDINSIILLNDIDLTKNTFSCFEYVPGSQEPIVHIIQNAEYSSNEFKNLQEFVNNLESKDVKFYNQLGSYVFPGVDYEYRTNYISYINISELIKKNNELNNTTFTNQELDFQIDSHTNSHQTLSNILTGIFTLNTDYLKKDIISESGEIQVIDYALDNGSQFQQNNSKDFLDKTVRWFLKEKNEDKELDVYGLTDFLDKKVWGYFIYFYVNSQEAFMHIITSLMLLGGVFVIGNTFYKFGEKKFLGSKVTLKDDVSLVPFASKFIIVASLFLIPIGNNQIVVPDKFLYSKNNQSEYLQNSSSTEYYQQISAMKAGLTFIANLGSTWANTVSDYSLHGYLRFLESKQAFITKKQIHQNEHNIEQLFKDIYFLKKNFDFFNNICKPLFANHLITYERFNNYNTTNKFTKNITTDNEFIESSGVNGVSFTLCQNLENSVAINSRKILADYASIRQSINISQAVVDNVDNPNAQQIGLQNFIDLMVFQQNNYGWINAITVPITYNLFFENGKSIFNHDIEMEKIKDDESGLLKSWSKNSPEKTEIFESADSSILSTILGQIQSKFVWFLLPGFDSVYNKIYAFFSNVAGLDPTAKQLEKEKDDSSVMDVFETAGSFISGVALGPLGMLAAAFGSVFSWITSFLGGVALNSLQYGLLMFATLLVSIFLFTAMITTLMLIIVATAGIIKIVIHFIEVIFTMVSSMILIFYGIVTGKPEYIPQFLGKALIVFILTPLSIVFASYIYIFVSTAASELYLLLIGLSYDTVIIANETVISNSANSFFNGLNATVSATSLKAIGLVVIHFISALFGVYMIFKMKDMLLEKIGITSDDSSLSRLTESLQHKVTGEQVRV